jgi:Rrf2 family protein
LINTVRGAKGGFYLSKSPNSINLMEIIKILEGSICFVDCVENPTLCDRSQGCISRDVWGEASRKVGEIFMGITLENMVERQRNKMQDSALFI